MIQKVESAIPNSLGDVDLPHQAPLRAGKQKGGTGTVEESREADPSEDEPSTRPPLRPRHLGIRLDLIA